MCVLYGVKKDELESWMKEHSEPAYRATQVIDWVWKKGILHFHEMKNIGMKLQNTLQESFQEKGITVKEKNISHDKETTKYVWTLHDGACIESVLIRAPDRKTVCVSSQVGCPARCSFCASGKRGLIRNLDAFEIVSQVLLIHHELLRNEGSGVDHVVYMGMGEPLENYDAVVLSIQLLTDPDLLGLSQRRITLSTVGVLEGILKLSEEGLRINLALSLHAPTQELRKKIIPYARTYELGDVIQAVRDYQRLSGRDITYEYTLIDGVNCEKEHAEQLVRLMSAGHCSVNLIPYNPVEGLSFRRPSTAAIQLFYSILKKAHIPTTCRFTKGDDIAAACGQLALRDRSDE